MKKAKKNTGKTPTPRQTPPSLKKQYLKSRPTCKVSFRVPAAIVGAGTAVALAGEFNDWNPSVDQMKRLKSGDFTLTKELETGKQYRFRYLIDEGRWENDPHADSYIPNPFGSDDSVILV